MKPSASSSTPRAPVIDEKAMNVALSAASCSARPRSVEREPTATPDTHDEADTVILTRSRGPTFETTSPACAKASTKPGVARGEPALGWCRVILRAPIFRLAGYREFPPFPQFR